MKRKTCVVLFDNFSNVEECFEYFGFNYFEDSLNFSSQNVFIILFETVEWKGTNRMIDCEFCCLEEIYEINKF